MRKPQAIFRRGPRQSYPKNFERYNEENGLKRVLD